MFGDDGDCFLHLLVDQRPDEVVCCCPWLSAAAHSLPVAAQDKENLPEPGPKKDGPWELLSDAVAVAQSPPKLKPGKGMGLTCPSFYATKALAEQQRRAAAAGSRKRALSCLRD